MSISPSIHQIAPSKWNSFEVDNTWKSPREAFSSGSNLLSSIANVVASIFENIGIAAKCILNKFIAIGNKTYELIFSRAQEDVATSDLAVSSVIQEEQSEPVAFQAVQTDAPVFTDIEEDVVTDTELLYATMGEEELPDVQVLEEPSMEAPAGTSWKSTAAMGTVGATAALGLAYIAWQYVPYEGIF